MNKSLTYSEYLTQKILKISKPIEKFLYLISISLLGSILLALSSKISFQIPFTPVPFTMQTFSVLFLSILLGRKVLYVLSLYIFEGIIGLPVFSKGGGIFYLLGPTGGYIFGFFVAGYVCGTLAEYGFDRSFVKIFFAMFIGNFIIYLFGFLWLLRFVSFDIYKALYIGVVPFIAGDLMKLVFTGVIFPLVWKKLK